MPFKFSQLEIPDVILIEPVVFRDSRGFFAETFKKPDFESHGIPYMPVQINHSRSDKNVIRGLHFQNNPEPQGKLVMVTNGEIFDVAVDIRKGSPTYGQWVGKILNSDNHNMLYIPEGFAHGFLALKEATDVVYQVTCNEYSPEFDSGVIWNDPDIGVNWPTAKPLLSKKDLNLPLLKNSDNNLAYKVKSQ